MISQKPVYNLAPRNSVLSPKDWKRDPENKINLHCAVPEKIHTHPMEGHQKFLGGGGVLKYKILEEKYEAKLKFPVGSGGGGGGVKQKTFHGGVWIFSGTAH